LRTANAHFSFTATRLNLRHLMDSSDVRTIRSALGLSTLDLAERLGVPQQLVLDWESATRFPTLKHARALTRLQADGVNGELSAPLATATVAQPHWLDPGWAELLRKLFAHPALYTEASRLAQHYQDPVPAGASDASEAPVERSLDQPAL
jgi:DNA-binding transcriptional regulator YiaG